MKVKYNDLINAIKPLRFLCDCEEVPFSCFPAIVSNARIIEKELDTFTELENELAMKYCKKDGEGNPIYTDNRLEVIKGEEENYIKEYTELCESEVDLPFKTVNANKLREIKMKPRYALCLSFMLDCEVE